MHAGEPGDVVDVGRDMATDTAQAPPGALGIIGVVQLLPALGRGPILAVG